MKSSLILAILILSVFFVSLVSAEKVNSSANVTYDPNLLRAFEDKDYADSLLDDKDFIGLQIIEDEIWAKVRIVLKDNSGIVIEGTKEEKRELVNQRVEWFEKETEKFLSGFSSENVININPNSGGFSALVSKEGLDELKDEEIIGEIIWTKDKVELILEESGAEGEPTSFFQKIIDFFKKILALIGIK